MQAELNLLNERLFFLAECQILRLEAQPLVIPAHAYFTNQSFRERLTRGADSFGGTNKHHGIPCYLKISTVSK